ncbi:hypothetical protein BDZ91DRAFT_257991 [Kalaharituber pfeilii]|nr:hypothetical protein BDZ91DRAFT_257991 [Kalaharituber pfeilii]
MGFQTGTFNTTEDHPPEPPKQNTMCWIPFERPYDAIPAVVLWLNSLDTCAGENQRIHVIASDVSKAGFRLYIHSWRETRLYTAGVSWLAYPAEAPGIESGNFLGRWGDVKFTKFNKPPSRVMVAFNKIDCNKNFNLRLTVKCEGITKGGMGWRVDTWGDSQPYDCGGAYIALE